MRHIPPWKFALVAGVLLACSDSVVAPLPRAQPRPKLATTLDSAISVNVAENMRLVLNLKDSSGQVYQTDTLRDTLMYYPTPASISFHALPDGGYKSWGVLVEDTVLSAWDSASVSAGNAIYADVADTITLAPDSATLAAKYFSFLASPTSVNFSEILALEDSIIAARGEENGNYAIYLTQILALGPQLADSVELLSRKLAFGGVSGNLQVKESSGSVARSMSNGVRRSATLLESERPVKILYINGINTTALNYDNDIAKFRATLAGDSANIDGTYNVSGTDTTTKAGCLMTTFPSRGRREGSAKAKLVFFAGKVLAKTKNLNCGLVADLVESALELTRIEENISGLQPPALDFAEKIRGYLTEGDAVIVVAHSQGTLMAQEALRYLADHMDHPEVLTKCVAEIMVAPVAAHSTFPSIQGASHPELSTQFIGKGLYTQDILLFAALAGDITPISDAFTALTDSLWQANSARMNVAAVRLQAQNPAGKSILKNIALMATVGVDKFQYGVAIHGFVKHYLTDPIPRKIITDAITSFKGTLRNSTCVGPVDNLAVSATKDTLLGGDTTRLTASATDKYSRTVPSYTFQLDWAPLGTVNYTSTTPAGANSSLFHATQAASVNVTATVKASYLQQGQPVGLKVVTVLRRPLSITIVSGDKQAAAALLPQPLKVAVFDSVTHIPVSGAVVQWVVVTGGGSVSNASAASDSLGVAQISWTLGSGSVEQTVTATLDSTAKSVTFHASTSLTPITLKVNSPQYTTLTVKQDSLALTAYGINAYGDTIPSVTPAWSKNGPTSFVLNTTSKKYAFNAADSGWAVASLSGASKDSVRLRGRFGHLALMPRPYDTLTVKLDTLPLIAIPVNARGDTVSAGGVTWTRSGSNLTLFAQSGARYWFTGEVSGKAWPVLTGYGADTANLVGKLGQITVTQPGDTLLTVMLDTLGIQVTAKNGRGETKSIGPADVTWTLNPLSNASTHITSAGRFWFSVPGNGYAVATANWARRDSVHLRGESGWLSITQPPYDTLTAGLTSDSIRIVANVMSARGVQVAPRTITWNKTGATSANLSVNPAGRVYFTGVGQGRVTAASQYLKSDSSSVLTGVLGTAHIDTPSLVFLTTYTDSVKPTAKAYNARHEEVLNPVLVWSSGNTAVMGYYASGYYKFTAKSTGAYAKVKTSWSSYDSTALSADLGRVQIDPPSNPYIVVNQGLLQLTAKIYNVRNEEIPGAVVAWDQCNCNGLFWNVGPQAYGATSVGPHYAKGRSTNMYTDSVLLYGVAQGGSNNLVAPSLGFIEQGLSRDSNGGSVSASPLFIPFLGARSTRLPRAGGGAPY